MLSTELYFCEQQKTPIGPKIFGFFNGGNRSEEFRIGMFHFHNTLYVTSNYKQRQRCYQNKSRERPAKFSAGICCPREILLFECFELRIHLLTTSDLNHT